MNEPTSESGRDVSVQQLMEDLRTVVGDAEALLAATAGAAGERVAEARRRAVDSLGQARQRLTALEREIGDRARAAAGEVEEYVRENPWGTIGLAVAAGLLVGVLVGRRRS